MKEKESTPSRRDASYLVITSIFSVAQTLSALFLFSVNRREMPIFGLDENGPDHSAASYRGCSSKTTSGRRVSGKKAE